MPGKVYWLLEPYEKLSKKEPLIARHCYLVCPLLLSFTILALIGMYLDKFITCESRIDSHSCCVKSNSSDRFRGNGRFSHSLLFKKCPWTFYWIEFGTLSWPIHHSNIFLGQIHRHRLSFERSTIVFVE